MSPATSVLFGILVALSQSESPAPEPAADTPAATDAGATPEQTSAPEAEPGATPTVPQEAPVRGEDPEATLEPATPEEVYLDELRSQVEADKARYREELDRRRAEREAEEARARAERIRERFEGGHEHRAPPKLAGHWRVALSVGRHEVLAENVDWFGGDLRPEIAAGVERNLGDLVELAPGLGARIGIAYTRRGRDSLSLDLAEIEAGVIYQYPHAGLWDLVFPYARADFVAGWAAVAASPELKDDLFIPGLGLTLGVRVALPRFGNGLRLFGNAELAYQYRSAVTPRLEAPPDPFEEEPLPGPAVPLGRVDPSAFVMRLGVGLEL